MTCIIKKPRVSICGLAMLSALGLFAIAATEKPDYILCRNNKLVRTVRVITPKEGPCKTIYTKAGVDRVVGSGEFHDTCFNFLANIKSNLEQASWSCKEVSSSGISRNTASE